MDSTTPVHRSTRLRPLWMLAGVLGGLFLGAAVAAVADGEALAIFLEDAPVRIPYEGFLTLDGEAAEGTLDVTFRLHSGDTCTDCELWAETQTVTFRRGRFSARLGETTSLAEVVLDAEPLYLSLEVAGVALAGRQALAPVPWVHAAAKAASVAVARLVPREGATTLNVHGDLLVGGSALRLATAHVPGGNNASRRALAHTANDTLTISPSGEFTRVDMGGNITIEGLLTTSDFYAISSPAINVRHATGRVMFLYQRADEVTAPSTGPHRTSTVTENWADCGDKLIQAVRLVYSNSRYDFQVKCKP